MQDEVRQRLLVQPHEEIISYSESLDNVNVGLQSVQRPLQFLAATLQSLTVFECDGEIIKIGFRQLPNLAIASFVILRLKSARLFICAKCAWSYAQVLELLLGVLRYNHPNGGRQSLQQLCAAGFFYHKRRIPKAGVTRSIRPASSGYLLTVGGRSIRTSDQHIYSSHRFRPASLTTDRRLAYHFGQRILCCNTSLSYMS